MQTEMERLQMILDARTGRLKDAERLSSRLEKENHFLEIEKGEAIKTLRKIQGMCGSPDAADGCRNILKVCEEFSKNIIKL